MYLTRPQFVRTPDSLPLSNQNPPLRIGRPGHSKGFVRRPDTLGLGFHIVVDQDMREHRFHLCCCEEPIAIVNIEDEG